MTAPSAPQPRASAPHRRALFLILPQVEIMDLAGPLQVLHEAGNYGHPYSIQFLSTAPEQRSEQGLRLADLQPFLSLTPTADDIVFISGVPPERFGFDYLDSEVPAQLFDWLRAAVSIGAKMCSICTGAFYLAHAGLLDHQKCTTHWKRAAQLAETYPELEVLEECLFVRSGRIYSSAGIASGIDLALWILEEEHGPLLAAHVAREMVVFMRRNGNQSQRSVFVDYRSHLNPGVHAAQDFIIKDLATRATIERLAEIACMSPRNLTRVFKQATGLTVHGYTEQLRVAKAEILLRDPSQTVDAVAAGVGLDDARQLRRLWNKVHGATPSEWRQTCAVVAVAGD